MINMKDGRYLGVDGCRGGWIACILDHGDFRLERFDSLEVLVDRYPEFDSFLIDMVIGLRSNSKQLRPENLARKELGPRSSTIFSVPCRQAVYAESEAEQKEENKKVLGKSLSKQSINIIPKIRELDEFLDNHPEYRNKILESHPELVFARLHGRVVMTQKKEFIGFKDRVNILERYLPDKTLIELWDKAKDFKCKQEICSKNRELLQHHYKRSKQ